MFPIISTLSDLASKVIDIWKALKESEDKKLDREHQLKLQDAQHKHERLRERQLQDIQLKQEIEKEFLERLAVEAELLSLMGFDVIFEPVGNGYGVALPVRNQKQILVFWLSIQYPNQPPKVLLRTTHSIEQIEFEEGAWQDDRTLAEIASALFYNP